MRFLTAGESHGEKLMGIIEGLPAGLEISIEQVNDVLARRQRGPGRGGRMAIEKDRVHIFAGMRGGQTTGAPFALEIMNNDWANWQDVMAVTEGTDLERKKVTAPRPGHADLTGALKYRTEVRNVLERASARETAMRVAVGNIARQLLAELGVEIRGRVVSVGKVRANMVDTPEFWECVRKSDWLTGDKGAEEEMWRQLEEARAQGESLGGVIEVRALNLPAGLGSYVHWDRKLDGRLAQAVLSIQAVKGVSFGLGFELGSLPGSQVHDQIVYAQGKGYSRLTNHAGGIEGGMSNGEPIILQAVMKPIPTLYHPLATVDMETKESVLASIERSDVCAVPAALVVAEHTVAWTLAEAVLEKFPADSFRELKEGWQAYWEYLRNN